MWPVSARKPGLNNPPACETHQLCFLARPLALAVGYLLVHDMVGCPAGMGKMCAHNGLSGTIPGGIQKKKKKQPHLWVGRG